jgi:serine/threonine-protein kinase
VLVTSDGSVKLLDFGIAKMIAGEAESESSGALTRLGQQMATPAYAAPEQVAGGLVTTRADVYALGAMLHELLCGQRLPAETRGAASPPVMLCSSRVDAQFAASVGGRTVKALRRELRGDLDAIVAKATEWHAERRYASVEALAADLERYRKHLPIEAQRIGRIQLAAKFVRRHRFSSALAAVLLGVSVLGTALVAWQAREAAQQARRAEAVKGFLAEIFSGSDPRIARDRPRGTMSARELLDIGAARIEKEFAADPPTEIDLLGTVADIYRELGVFDRAGELEEKKVRLARAVYGELSPVVVDAAVSKAAHDCDKHGPECAKLQLAADALLNRAGMNASPSRALWWVAEGERLRALPGRETERRTAYENAIALYARVAPHDPGRVTAVEELASEHQQQGDYAGAVSLHEQALLLAMALPRRNDAELQTIHGNRALAFQQAGDLLAASAEFDLAADIAERTSGVDFETFWDIRGNAARTRHLAGDRERADALFEALMTHLPPPSLHSISAYVARELYGERLAAEGRPLLALPLLEAAEREFIEHPRDEFDLRRVRLRLGDALDRVGRHAEARGKFADALTDYEKHSSPGEQPLLAMRERWGRFLLDHGEAEAAAVQFSEVVKQGRDRQWVHVALAHAGLARVALHYGDVAAALAESAQAVDLWERRQGFYDVRMAPYLQRVRADALALSGELTAAQALEDAAFAASERYDAPESPTRRHRNLSRPAVASVKPK